MRDFRKAQLLILSACIALLCVCSAGCSSSNLDDVKAHAPDVWESIGFKIVGYEGYRWGTWLGGNYGGAEVWYRLERDGNGISYTGYIQKWGDEYHIYGPKATDAIRP